MIRQIFEKHPHWQAVLGICEKLRGSGHMALLAGGCVRDGLLNKTPNDFDIATGATPDQVQDLFPNAKDVGRHFGVMIVPMDGASFEVATFRADGPYLDGRHPSTVSFTNAREDALRRDFTVNALFYDPTFNKILDYVEGLKDLEARIIRAVGDPKLRFEEDKLRILRAVRFVSQLGFEIDPATAAAGKELASELYVVSKERITEELRKLAMGQHLKKAIQLAFDLGVLKSIWPELTFPYAGEELWKGTLRVTPFLSATKSFTLFMGWLLLNEALYRESGHAEARKLIESAPFRLTKQEMRDIEYLIRGFFEVRERKKSAFLLLADDRGPLLTELCSLASVAGLIDEDNVAKVIDEFLDVVDEEGGIPAPLIRGDDLLALGYEPTTLKLALESLYIEQLQGHIGDRDRLLEMAKQRQLAR